MRGEHLIIAQHPGYPGTGPYPQAQGFADIRRQQPQQSIQATQGNAQAMQGFVIILPQRLRTQVQLSAQTQHLNKQPTTLVHRGVCPSGRLKRQITDCP